MATKGEIYLDGTLLTAYGRTFSQSVTEISREARTASGKLVQDIIASKKVFTLAYSFIDGNDLQVFEDFYAEQATHRLEFYFESTTTTTTTDDPTYHVAYTVIMRPIDKTRTLLISDGLWSNVKIVFEEV